MSKTLLVLSLSGLLSGAVAFAYPNPYGPPCGLGVSYDSYGRGIDDGFTGNQVGAQLLDPQCYAWGVEAGKTTRSANDGDFCTEDFSRGRQAGYALEAQDADGECYSQGYKAGEAALDIDAREGHAAQGCQDAYNQGVSEAKSHTAGSSPSDRVPAHCYQLGLFEGA